MSTARPDFGPDSPCACPVDVPFGTDCGACHGEIERMLHTAEADRSGPRKLPVIAPNAPGRAA